MKLNRLDELLKTDLGKKQYKELALKYHSDLNNLDDEEIMKEINSAKDDINGDYLIGKLYKKYILNSEEDVDNKTNVKEFIQYIMKTYFSNQYSNLRTSVIKLRESTYNIFFYYNTKNRKMNTVKETIDFKSLEENNKKGIDYLTEILKSMINSIIEE